MVGLQADGPESFLASRMLFFEASLVRVGGLDELAELQSSPTMGFVSLSYYNGVYNTAGAKRSSPIDPAAPLFRRSGG